MGCSKNSSKREIYSNTNLPQEIRKTSDKKTNLTPKATREKKTKINRRKQIIKIGAEINKIKKIEKINETRSSFFEKINKTDRALARFIKKKGQSPQINKLEMKKEKLQTDAVGIQRIIRNSYKQLYSNEMNSLEEMAKLLERYNLPRLTKE